MSLGHTHKKKFESFMLSLGTDTCVFGPPFAALHPFKRAGGTPKTRSNDSVFEHL